MTNRRSVLAVLAVLVAALVWWLQPADSGPSTAADPSSSPASRSNDPAIDPASGLAWVEVDSLPSEAAETLSLIDDGGPFPYDQDGGTFGNFEGLLPDRERGYYREYTVDTPGSADRGARRIISGGPGEFYWTADHYQSFERIRR